MTSAVTELAMVGKGLLLVLGDAVGVLDIKGEREELKEIREDAVTEGLIVGA